MRAGFYLKSSILMLYEQQRNRGWEFMWQNHNPGLNMKHPWIHQENAPLRSAASRLHQQDRQWGGTGQKLPWTTKHLHGMYHRQIEETAGIKKSHQWLEKNTLEDCTEALIMAAQEEALSIRSIELGLYHSQQDQSYRLPKGAPETIWHIATWGKVQAGNEHNASTTKCLG